MATTPGPENLARERWLDEAEARHELRRRTRRAFLIGGAATVAGVAGFNWLTNSSEEGETSWPMRRVLDFNGRLWRSYFSDARLLHTYSPRDIRPLKPNGDVGVTGPVPADWALHVNTGGGVAHSLNLDDIRALPKVEMITRFCCVEGWSTVTQWGGARFADFTRKYFPASRPLPNYVSMATPDKQYYVGLDMKSALHPQTLLAYEQNGAPLLPEHGAPLRLVIPVKYGIKNLKRIGSIEYPSQRPSDYWADEGYDWFAGL